MIRLYKKQVNLSTRSVVNVSTTSRKKTPNVESSFLSGLFRVTISRKANLERASLIQLIPEKV